jgi:hypothetical protein
MLRFSFHSNAVAATIANPNGSACVAPNLSIEGTPSKLGLVRLALHPSRQTLRLYLNCFLLESNQSRSQGLIFTSVYFLSMSADARNVVHRGLSNPQEVMIQVGDMSGARCFWSPNGSPGQRRRVTVRVRGANERHFQSPPCVEALFSSSLIPMAAASPKQISPKGV